jgi:type IV pilus assembly protein PilC
MIRFNYKAFNKKQERVAGQVEAKDQTQAAAILRSKEFLVLSLKEVKPDLLTETWMKFQKPSLEDISNFTRQLSTMITAGLPLVEALNILKGQSKAVMGEVIGRVASNVEGGMSLSEAMKKNEGVFSGVYVALIQAGEAAGVLDKILKKMADVLEKQRQFASKTRGALIYPGIITVMMVVVASLMMIFVVPKMTAMYQDFGADLPLPTKILIGLSDFMVGFWPLLLILGFLGYGVILRWSKTEIGGLIIEKYMFKLPIVGPLKRTMILTEFARTLGLLASAGISILDALRIVAEAMGSRIYRDGVLQAADRVEKGVSLAEAMSGVAEFPAILGQMIAVGEQTGRVDETLLKLAAYYEEESETKVKTLTTAIEPLIMIVMGVAVGFLVFAVITPIYDLTSKF